MHIHTAFPIDGAPVFGTFGGSTIAELQAIRDAGMNLIVTGAAPLDVDNELGRFCGANRIKVMYSLAGQVHARPRLVWDLRSSDLTIPIVDGTVPTPSGIVQIDDELIHYNEAAIGSLLGCERGFGGTTPSTHEQATILFWPDLARAEIERVKDSPNLWGYWVLDDSPGFARSVLLALNALVKRVDGSAHAVCAGHSGVGTLRNFAPGTCDILAFYYYPFSKDGYLRTLNSMSAQWTLTEARRQAPGIPFLGTFQGFWEHPTSDRQVNCTEPLKPWQIREQIEDFVRDGAAGILGYAAMDANPTFAGWNSRLELIAELRRIRDEIAATGGVAVPEEPAELTAIRIQPQGSWSAPRQIPGLVPAWNVIGPFDAGDAGLDADFPPDSVIDLSGNYAGKSAYVQWRAYRTSAGALGLVETFGAPHTQEHCTAYATCIITSPREQRVQMRFGSDDDAIVYLDGAEVWRHMGSRGVVPDSDIVPVTLRAGETRILVKVHNRVDQWGLFMRFTDADGRPLEGLGYSPSGDAPVVM